MQPNGSNSSIEIGGKRNPQLDLLRGIAILMVLVCHTQLFRTAGWEAPVVRFGWAGVDLFFVLSGFLISGLLFSEYQRTGTISFRRFAARRALKIYPAFYVIVLLTLGLRLLLGHPLGQVIRTLARDVLFVQSYSPGTYGHFWSLSVEEHFYILLPLGLFVALRRAAPGDRDPFRLLPLAFAVVAIAALVARLLTAKYVLPFAWQTHLMPTHLRIDSLMFGVLLSYLSYFHGERLWSLVRVRRMMIFVLAALLLSPGLIISQYDQWMYTYGFSVIYLGFGALLLATLAMPSPKRRPISLLFRGVEYIGGFSYSIYLWHIAWLGILTQLHLLHVRYVGLAIYISGALVVGILMARAVEVPALKLRDRMFPRQDGGRTELVQSYIKGRDISGKSLTGNVDFRSEPAASTLIK